MAFFLKAEFTIRGVNSHSLILRKYMIHGNLVQATDCAH